MKTKLIPPPNKTALTHPFKYASVALAAAVGLMSASQAQAQYVTGTPTLSNVPTTMTAPSALYSSWTSATITSSAAGFTVNATGYGSCHYVVPVGNRQTLNVNDTQAVLTFTLNDSGASQSTVWVGVPIILDDNAGGSYTIGGYVGEFGGPGTWSGANNNICTVTMTLPAALIASIQAGGDTINTFNLQFDPSVYSGSSYNVTFNSLVLQPVGGLPAGSPNITSYQYNSPTSSTLIWTSQASGLYTVRYSTNLLTGFTALVSDIASGGTTTTNTVTVPAGDAGFFQILQQ